MFEDDKPEGVEAEGKTVDEAVRKALIATGWLREQIAVEVLDPPIRGAWVGGAPARVRVRRRTADVFELAPRVTAEILERMGLSGRVRAERRPDHIQVLVEGDGLEEKLIGAEGEGLDALQHLVARIVSKQSGSRQMVSVDLGGYRERRERQLRDMAYELADAVRQTGRQVMTEPMVAAERRVVHLALNEDPDITTFAVGDGLVKPIAIAPIDQAPPPEERRPSDRRRYGGSGERGGSRDRERGRGYGQRREGGDRGPRHGRGEGRGGTLDRERGGEGRERGDRERDQPRPAEPDGRRGGRPPRRGERAGSRRR